jgi:hypothetical protein
MDSEVAKNTCNYRSLSVSLLDNSAAIKPLLQQQLSIAITLTGCKACALSGMGIAPADTPGSTKLLPEMIPLYRLPDDTVVLYRSAIALKLAPLWQLPVLDIAHQLVASFLTINQDTTGQICLDFSIEVLSSGWIEFQLSDWGLATWLQHSTHAFHHDAPQGWGELDSPMSNKAAPFPSPRRGGLERGGERLTEQHCPQPPLIREECVSPDKFFPVQYAHARCCSLLRLAHTQGLIKLRDLDFNTVSWQLVEPNPIPWLNDDQGGDTGKVLLRLVYPAEQRLIAQILDVQDVMNDQAQLSGVKLATALSIVFERFYSSCRIWGEVKSQTPKLAQARLGLVVLTQALLRSLLQDYLGVPAPIEL